MQHAQPDSYKMKPFELPAAFGDGEPTVEFIGVDEREHALESVSYLADLVYGDIVLVPFVDGQPDWPSTTRDTVEKFSGDWTELDPEDVPRLGILTDSFAKFLDYGDDISVLTLWRGGTPEVRQIAGKLVAAAVAIVEDAIVNEWPLTVIPRETEREPPKGANDNQPPISWVSPTDWQDAPIPVREWWLPDLVPMRQVTILNGDGGVGKSLLELQFAACGALQCETLGLRPLPGRVMYIGAEDAADEFHRRLADIVYAHQRQLSDLDDFALLPLADADALLSVPDKSGIMQPTRLWGSIVESAKAFLPRLIVLDTAADLFGGDEIKRAQVRQFIAMLRKLAMEIDCAIVLLAHPSVQGMQSGTGSSGSTAWNNSVRSRLYLTSDGDVRILKTMKANYGKAGAEIKMRWSEGVFVLDDGKMPEVAALLHGRHNEVFLALLSKLNRQGQRLSPSPSQSHAPKVMATQPEAKGVSKKDLAAAQQRLLDSGTIKIVEEGPPSRRYKRLIVASEDFGERGSNYPSNSFELPANYVLRTPPIPPVECEGTHTGSNPCEPANSEGEGIAA